MQKLATITYSEFKTLMATLTAARAHFARRVNAVVPRPALGQTDDPCMDEKPAIDWPEMFAYQTTMGTLARLEKELDTRTTNPTFIQSEYSEEPETGDTDNDPYLNIYVTSEAARDIMNTTLNAALYVALNEKPEGYRKRLALLERLGKGSNV